MTTNTCRLCSRLSSGLKDFFYLLITRCCRCRKIFDAARPDDYRVDQLISASPACACERCKVSRYSPGIVTASEGLTRFVLHDFHFNKKTGRAKPNCFGHVNSRGCSIQRETVATTDELVSFLKKFFAKNKNGKWHGVLSASCGPVRKIEVDGLKGRAVCVYDTAMLDNPAHGEMFRGIAMDDPDDRLELQHALFVAFGNGVISVPSQYRNGDVHARPGLLKATPLGDRH